MNHYAKGTGAGALVLSNNKLPGVDNGFGSANEDATDFNGRASAVVKVFEAVIQKRDFYRDIGNGGMFLGIAAAGALALKQLTDSTVSLSPVVVDHKSLVGAVLVGLGGAALAAWGYGKEAGEENNLQRMQGLLPNETKQDEAVVRTVKFVLTANKKDQLKEAGKVIEKLDDAAKLPSFRVTYQHQALCR